MLLAHVILKHKAQLDLLRESMIFIEKPIDSDLSNGVDLTLISPSGEITGP